MSHSTRQVFLLIVSYTALAVAWGWRLHANDAIPGQADQQLAATRIVIAKSLAHAPKHLQQAAVFQLALLPEHEVRALQRWLQTMPEQRVRQLTVQQGPVQAPCPLNAALLFVELSRADAPPVDDSRLLVSASGNRLEEPHKIAVLELLGSQAIANNELSLAVAIHERVCESPAATWENIQRLTEAARLARRPAAALRVINVWLAADHQRLDATQREEALDWQTTLLLEGTRYAEASRIVLDELRALPATAAIPPRLMQRALLATHAAGEAAELLPWIERHLRTFPDHQCSIADLAADKKIAADYRLWLHEAATIADLHQHTSIACEMFFRLAAAGETSVLARLHALASQIGRGQELTQLLTALQPRHSTLQIAQALAAGNAPAPARDLLATHLRTTTTDRDAWRLLTELDVTLGGNASAAVLWESFLRRFPGDVPARQTLARLQIDAAQYPQALRTLLHIPGEHLDEATLRQIASLAIQLDDIATAHRAQQLLVDASALPTVSDVITLAHLTQQHPDAAAQTILAAAVAKLPSPTPYLRSLAATPTTGSATSFSTAVEAKAAHE